MGSILIEVIYWSESTSKFVWWCEVSDYPCNSFPGDPHDFEQWKWMLGALSLSLSLSVLRLSSLFSPVRCMCGVTHPRNFYPGIFFLHKQTQPFNKTFHSFTLSLSLYLSYGSFWILNEASHHSCIVGHLDDDSINRRNSESGTISSWRLLDPAWPRHFPII